MSWKGFKKAVVRLPHMLQSKAGYSDSNYVDSEFDELRSQFEELQQLSVRLHDAASKYREAVQSMLKHQEAFSKVLLEVYEPIPGKFEGSSGALSGQTNSMKRIRQQTAETSLSRAQLFQQSCSNLSAELMSQIDVTIERGIIMPANDYINLHKQIVKTFTKRDHKKIDYDRHSDTLKKAKTAQEDDRKVMKAQNSVDSAFKDFDKYNSLLKTQLPVYIQLRIAFIDPVLVAIIHFQNQLFSQITQHMDPLRSLVDMRFSAVDGFELQKESISSLFRDVSLLTNVNNGIAGQSSTGQFDDDDDGNDANEAATNPFHPANTETPAQPPPVSTNPFFPIPGTAGSSGTPVISAKPVPLPISKKPAVPLPQTQQQKPPTKPAAVCLFDFDPQQAGDLKIRKGDRLEVLERTEDANGWWRGRLISSGEEGLFPGNYVRLMQ